MSKFLDRRDLAKILGAAGASLGAGGLALPALSASKSKAKAKSVAKPIDLSFPKNFVWGCATAAYQIEGAVKEDGRGQTNWDVFSHTAGKVANSDTGDVACNSYHLYGEDIKLLSNLGAGAYRFSIAWARIFPEGRGAPNQKGIDHYNRVVDALLAAGIEPYVTMFHWDLPIALQGGWQNRDTAYAFADYAGFMAAKLSDRVNKFMTTNEISVFTDVAYKWGIHAPGLKLEPKEANQVRHHGVLAHGLGLAAMRASVKGGTQIGLAENPSIYVPVIETADHIAAAQKATRIENAKFLTAILEGKYLEEYLTQEGKNAPSVKEGDMNIIGAPVDFVALNVYTPQWVKAANTERGYEMVPHTASSPRMVTSWLYYGPEVAYWAVRHVSKLWQPKTMYISENGTAAADPVVNGSVDDVDRVMFLRHYLGQFRRAIAEGYPLKGYFLWSLMDNFEWSDGYASKFGIHHVDFKTQKRTPKLSAKWYKEVIKNNRLV